MSADPVLLEELRLLRAMGEDGRRAATLALRSARLGRRPEHPGTATEAAAPTPETPGNSAGEVSGDEALKFMLHNLDAAIVARGGGSIFAPKPRGELSAAAEARLEAWQWLTPRRHPDATGRKPNEPEGFHGPRRKPGRLLGTLTGKLGGYASDREDER